MRDLTQATPWPTSRRTALVLAGAGAALLLGYAGAYTAAGPGVARGTTVLGVPIGGRSVAEATEILRRELADEQRRAMPVRAGDATTTVDPARAGLSLDVAATADSARARSWNPLELLDALIGGDEVDPVVRVDRAALNAEVELVASRLDREPVDGAVRFDQTGQIAQVQPRDGVRLRIPAARQALAAEYLGPAHLAQRPVRLPARVVSPRVGQAELDRVVREIAEPAVSAPVTVNVSTGPGGAPAATVALEPKAIASALTFAADPTGRLMPQLDGEALHEGIAEELDPVEKPARDATFDVSSGRPRVVPGRQGRAVDPQQLASAVLPVLTVTGPGRTADVALTEAEPELTTAEAESLGVRQLVAAYTTYYPNDFPPRLTNIHRAADLMDGTLVLPGKVFSFNKTVGERTAERGFAAGFIINGGRLEVDYGGGVSQLATTTFNAAYFAGLEIVEHNPHSFYISRYPEGRESTIAWGVKDLRIRNDSPHGIFLTTSYTDTSVTVRVWGTKRYRVESSTSPRYDITPYRRIYDPRPPGTTPGSCVATDGVSGFKVVVTRTLYPLDGGPAVRTDTFRTTYAPEHEVICGRSAPEPRSSTAEPPPTSTPTPSPSPSPAPPPGR